MRKVLLSLFVLFFALCAHADNSAQQVVDACISADGMKLRITLNHLSYTNMYIYIPGITTTSGIPDISYTHNPQDPTSVDFNFDLTGYATTPLTGCVAITYSGDPVSGHSGSTYTPLTICPCTEPTPTGCFYMDVNGADVVKLVSTNPNIDNYYLWNPSDLSGMHYVANGPGTLDADGVHYDYYFPNYPLSIQNGCATIYYSTQLGDGTGSYDPTKGTWANTLTICPCPLAPVSQCYSDDGSGNLTIKLSYPIFTDVRLFTQTGAGATAYSYDHNASNISFAVPQDASGNYIYTFVIPTSDIPLYIPNSTGCYTFYVSTEPWDPANVDASPADFATPIRICPCCSQGTANSHISYTLSTQSTNPLTVDFSNGMGTNWDFGDGHTATNSSNVNHTYTTAGSYTVSSSTHMSILYNGTGLWVPDCTKSDMICLTGTPVDRTQNINNNNVNVLGPCGVDFTASINGNFLSLTIPQTFTGGLFNAYPATRYIIWGDSSPDISFSGALPSFTVSHTYSAAGTYVVYCSGVAGCLTGLSICIDDNDHNEQRRANPNTPIPTTVQQKVQDINLFPNPATDVTMLTFNLQNAATIKVDVVDVVGRVVLPVSNIAMNPGNQKVEINTSNLASGIYNVNIQTDKGITTKRLSVVK